MQALALKVLYIFHTCSESYTSTSSRIIIYFVLKTSTLEEDEEEGRAWEREGWKDKLLFADAPKEPMCFW